MRNLRKFTAAVLAIALVLTSMTATFAASTTNEFEAQATVLKDLGILQGDTNGDLMLNKGLTRAEGAVLVLKTVLGKTEADQKAADTATLSTFADAKVVPAWAKSWIALAVKEGVLKGTTDNNLNAAGPLKGKDLASMFMNALGFSAENQYATAVELLAAKSKGTILVKIAKALEDVDLTRDAASAVVFDTLTATAKDAKATVVVTFVGTDATLKAVAEKAGLIVAASTLDVASVSATNLRELVIAFTSAPKADEAKKAANYKIGSDNPETATVSADGKTVTLTTFNAKPMGNYGTVDLTIVKAVGFDADKVVKGIAIKDITPPTAVSLKTTGPKTIKVTLSEPLDSAKSLVDINNSMKLDAGLLSIDTSTTTLSGLELTIKTFSDMAEGSHKLELLYEKSTLVDNAGYKLQATTLTFDYVKDTSPLTLEYVESNEKTVTIKFNKTVKTGWTTGTDVKFSHTYKGSYEVAASAATSTDAQKYVIAFTSPFPPSATTVYIANADKIEDDYGNKLTVSSFTINTVADVTKPTVSSVVFKEKDTIEVTYSEVVDTTTAQDVANYTLKSGTDTIQVLKAEQKSDDKKVVTLTTNVMNGGTYTLTIKKVIDTSIAKNEIAESTTTFTGTDKVAPEVKSIKVVADKKVKITFSEAMDLASITDKSVYMVGTTKLIGDDALEAVEANKAVVITFKNAIPTGDMHIARVKDVAGNWADFYDKVQAIDAKTLIGLAEYQVISKNQIKLKIEDTIKDMSVSDFNYKASATDTYTTPNGLSVSYADGNTFIVLTTKTDITSTTGAGVAVKTVGTTSAKNDYGTTLDFNKTSGAVDKCAPGMKTAVVATKAAKKSGTQVTTITITYSEDLYAASIQEADYTVTGYEIDGVALTTPTTVVITVKDVDYASYSATDGVKVKQVGEIQDSVKNILGAQDEWTAK